MRDMKPRYQKIFNEMRKDNDMNHLSDEDLKKFIEVYAKLNKKFEL